MDNLQRNSTQSNVKGGLGINRVRMLIRYESPDVHNVVKVARVVIFRIRQEGKRVSKYHVTGRIIRESRHCKGYSKS